jgi:hypothetical protein
MLNHHVVVVAAADHPQFLSEVGLSASQLARHKDIPTPAGYGLHFFCSRFAGMYAMYQGPTHTLSSMRRTFTAMYRRTRTLPIFFYSPGVPQVVQEKILEVATEAALQAEEEAHWEETAREWMRLHPGSTIDPNGRF